MQALVLQDNKLGVNQLPRMAKIKRMTEIGKKLLVLILISPSLFPIRDACVHTSSSNRSPRSAAADLYVALLPHREAQPVLTANTLSVLVQPVFQSLSCDFA